MFVGRVFIGSQGRTPTRVKRLSNASGLRARLTLTMGKELLDGPGVEVDRSSLVSLGRRFLDSLVYREECVTDGETASIEVDVLPSKA